jgi:trimeric autotransporter adhesin
MANTFTPTALANGTSNLLVRGSAINQTTDLLQAGAVFNDAARLSLGLFSTPQNSGNSIPFLGEYTTDIHAVQNDIAAMLAAPGTVTINGNAFALNATDTAVLTNVQAQLGQLLAAAPQTTNAATLAAADQTIHNVQAQILQEIQGDAHLSAALNNVTFMANTGANDVAFQSLPAGNDSAANLAAATAGTSLKVVGEVFNAGADLAMGGISNNNLAQVTADFTAVQQGLTKILGNATMLAQIEKGETANAAQLTTIHLQTILNQINTQLNKYDPAEVNANPTALRGTADNLLDIIDIAQNDAAINAAAGGTGAAGHVGGFAEMPGGLTGSVQKFQDSQVQTNFWAAFLAEGNTINATLTKIANGSGTATAALVTQIQNYEAFGRTFDAAQGAVFQGRFDNELNGGTLQADTMAAVKGLQGILNGDTGAALAADKAMITAAGQGFAADAMDVAGNNIAIGGATYVGSATTVSTATSVHGLAQGAIPVTANPNIANGTGGTVTSPGGGGGGGGGGAGGAMPINFNPTALANGTSNLLVRASALQHTTDLVTAGVVFNDSARLSLGLFSTPANSGGSVPFLGEFTQDITAVQTDIAAMLANPGAVTLGGKAFTLNATDTAVLTNIQGQLTTILNAAPQTTNAATLAAADQTIHNVEAQILQEIKGDAHLSGALNGVTFLANTGATDVAFQGLPAGNDSAANLAAATAGTSLKAVGEVFNAGADLAMGGINANNLNQITADFTAVQQGLTKILGNATALAAIEKGETATAAQLTTIHLNTVLQQINTQLNKYDANEVNANPTALRGTADNLLDIIDIVQNDANLNMAAGGNGTPGHIGGFAEMPGGLTGSVQKFQDSQVQTNFWAAFLAEGNTINATLTKIGNGSGTATAALVTQIQNYEAFGRTFDAAQGAVFQGRFDNELNGGTLQADTMAAVKGLQGILNGDTGAALAADKAMVAAAGQGFAADAMDVSGNNIPVNGGTYVGTATTVSTATSIKGTAQGAIPVTATPNIANGTGGAATTSTSQGGMGHGHDADDHSTPAAGAAAKPAAAPATAANTHATQPAATSHATGATHTMITMHDLMHAEAVAHQMHWA